MTNSDALSVLNTVRICSRAGTDLFPAFSAQNNFQTSIPESAPNAVPSTLMLRLMEDLRAPVRAMVEPRLVALPPEMHIFDALRCLQQESARVAVVQETKDTILGAISRNTLERLSCHHRETQIFVEQDLSNSTVAAVMGRNVSIETSGATVLEVIERMTVGGCPFVLIVNEFGHPYSMLDPFDMIGALSILEEFPAHGLEMPVSLAHLAANASAA